MKTKIACKSSTSRLIFFILQIYTPNALWHKELLHFGSEDSFYVLKLSTRKSKLSVSHLLVFCTPKSQQNFSQKNNFIVTEISFVVGEKFHRKKE